jgi:hypothetical protein
MFGDGQTIGKERGVVDVEGVLAVSEGASRHLVQDRTGITDARWDWRLPTQCSSYAP